MQERKSHRKKVGHKQLAHRSRYQLEKQAKFDPWNSGFFVDLGHFLDKMVKT